MAKKVTVISTSIRPNSNSELLAKSFAEGAEAAGNEVTFITLKDKDIRFCRGCLSCHQTGKCIIQDDVAPIMDVVLHADVVVWATPIYYFGMSGQMKTLIDRCCARYTEITNKNFYFIVTAAEPSIPAMERTIDGFRGFLDCLEGAREKGIIYGTGVWKVGEIEGKPVLKEAYEIGEKI